MSSALVAEHALLREAFRDLLQATMTPAALESCYEAPERLPRSVWSEVAEAGWLALLDEGEVGILDVTLLAEEAGARLLAGPFAATVAVVLPLLRQAGAESIFDEVARGSAIVAPVLPVPAWEDGLLWRPQLRCETSASGGASLYGTAPNVPYLAQAERVLVIAEADDGGARAFLLDPGSASVRIESGEAIDATRPLASLALDGVSVEASDCLAGADADLHDQLPSLMRAYVSMSNGEALGGSGELIRRTVEYVSERRQFGQPVGSFQAVKHLIANAEVAREVARALAHQAAVVPLEQPDSGVDLLCGRVLVAEAFTEVAEIAIQCFGGFGFTWEYELHLWYRRALVEQTQPAPLSALRCAVEGAMRSEVRQ
jgi:acyl-CoA dehydrogenase